MLVNPTFLRATKSNVPLQAHDRSRRDFAIVMLDAIVVALLGCAWSHLRAFEQNGSKTRSTHFVYLGFYQHRW